MLVEIDRLLGDAANHDAIAEHVGERGVISDPPPTPVMPTSSPTPKPVTSPGSSRRMTFASSVRSVLAPETFSRKTFATWRS